MRFSSLLYFYRLRLRQRWLQELFALIGIAVGVALLFAAQVANTSLTGSVAQVVEGTFGRADLQLASRSSHGFPERTVAQVRDLPGVRTAAPLYEVRANVLGPGGRRAVTVLGADTSLPRVAGAMLQRFRSARLPGVRAVAVPTPIARALDVPPGGTFRIEVHGRLRRVRLALEFSERDIGPLIHSPLVVVPLPFAQELGGLPRRVTRIMVDTMPGRTAEVGAGLRRIAAGHLNVRPADFDVRLFRRAAAPSSQSTGLFAAISALIGFLFAFNAMLLTLPARQRVVADLRIDGYSPAAVLQVVLFDALVLGVVASITGLLLGDFVSREVFDRAPEYLSFAFPVSDQRIVTSTSVAVALAGGIAATLLAALLPLGGILRRRPGFGDTRSEASTERAAPLAFAGGSVCLAASVSILVAAPQAAIAGTALLVAALMLMLPAFLHLILRLADRLLSRVRSAVPMISVGELRSMPGRSMAVAATGALAVFGIVAIQGARGDLLDGLGHAARDLDLQADVWVAPRDQLNLYAASSFRRSSDALRRVPEVQEVRPYRGAFLDIGDRRVWILGPPPETAQPIPPSQLVAGDLEQATRRLRGGGWAVVSEALADERGLAVGDRFKLMAPTPRTFRIAGLSTNIGWPPGAVVINADDYRRAWDSPDATAFHVTLQPGVPPERGRAAVAQALGSDSAFTVETGSQRLARHQKVSNQAMSRLNQIAALMLVAAILAMAAASAGMVWQRRTRLASLKLDGFTDVTVWRALLLESTLLLGAGCGVGALFGLVGQQLLDRALGTVTGFPVTYSVALEVALASFAVVTLVAVAIAAAPGYLAARVRPGLTAE